MNLKSLIPVERDRTGTNPFMSLQREIDRLFDDFSVDSPPLPITARPRSCRAWM